jgi:hypothetical protein
MFTSYNLFMHRMTLRVNRMDKQQPCGKCKNCTCRPCDTLPVDADITIEVDDGTFRPYHRDTKETN